MDCAQRAYVMHPKKSLPYRLKKHRWPQYMIRDLAPLNGKDDKYVASLIRHPQSHWGAKGGVPDIPLPEALASMYPGGPLRHYSSCFLFICNHTHILALVSTLCLAMSVLIQHESSTKV